LYLTKLCWSINDGLAGLDPKYMSRIDTHIRATGNDSFYIR